MMVSRKLSCSRLARTVKKPTLPKGMKPKKVTAPQAKAFSVHLLTASGSFLAFLSVVAASEESWTAMFWWLGLALFVDGIDGPIARKLDVKYVLPNWSGELLDNIIDYMTYVLIPAFALYQRGFMGEGLSFLAAAIIVVSSAIYYADTGMKTKENFFKGFPVVWNMVVFTLFIVRPGEWVAFAIVLAAAIVSFLPIYFLHPVRVQRLRPLNLAIFFIWCALGALSLYQQLDSPTMGARRHFGDRYLSLRHRRGDAAISQSGTDGEGIMVKAIRVHHTGGPEVLTYEDISIAAPGPGEVHIRNEAIGLNFLDVYFRTELYPAPKGLPFVPGNEGAGVVLSVAADVKDFKPGDRVACTPVSNGAPNAEERLIPAVRLVKLPDAIAFEQAASMMLKGMTAQYLLRQTFPVKQGHTILFHAAAGGVGLIAGQWAKHLGSRQ